MKILNTIALALLFGYPATAQTDTLKRLPDTVRTGNSPNPDSWYNTELPKDAAPFKDSVLLQANEIPRKLKRTLDGKDEFEGWRKGDLYFDKVNQHYKLFMRSETNTTRFILTGDGKIISVVSYHNR